jgi:hypothetical protein
MVNRKEQGLDRGTTVNPTKKKKPKRLGLYREGKSMMEKIVKETFIPDDDGEVKKGDKVIEEVIGDRIEVPDERGSIQYANVQQKKQDEINKKTLDK